MDKTEAIKTLLDTSNGEAIGERLERIEFMLLQIGASIAIPQKDAAKLLEVTDDTMRNMALRGEIETLQSDGSNRNFYTLNQIAGLKFRKQRKRK